ncbi:MAG: ABC transporter ATP-binding protein [Deltaproteobacteria bacterium]|nr:ABC transporter ATP-binding protein [Deltaproteobacteria bacterium]
MPLLSLQQISFSYSSHLLFEDLSFSLAQNDFLGILGTNGCGKSTLLKLMAGILKPSQGEVCFQNKKLSQYSAQEKARSIAMLSQEVQSDFPFRVLEVVLMGRFPYIGRFSWENKKDMEIARYSLSLVDALHLEKRILTELSGGEKQRVFLAQALAQAWGQKNQVLLLDEPLTHLDLKHQIELCELLKKLHQEKDYTLVVVLHDLHFASKLCSRLLMLKGGKVKVDAVPSEALNEKNIREVFDLKADLMPNIYGQVF